jgi:hypothetical protein
MHREDHAKPCLPRRVQDLQHVRNAVVRFRNRPMRPQILPPLEMKLLIGIDDEKRREAFAKGAEAVSQICGAV